jgi:hypothetical protein
MNKKRSIIKLYQNQNQKTLNMNFKSQRYRPNYNRYNQNIKKKRTNTNKWKKKISNFCKNSRRFKNIKVIKKDNSLYNMRMRKILD